ncbi:MAG: ABC transporter ATP-binding protein/permease [Oscillospiraceae bacterium]|nr:ABC transporter ATP-binding protein/permease [Oscillospiraceae bacterium]
MLQIRNISKTYQTGPFVQQALNDLSLDLRDNEFVAVLGPSGSGKTTLLNVIGGLDHYDSGDLIINGISTKKYKARDWDAYRNHSIGFVFQSYNLIPHQTVLRNVELALTIGGVSKRERTRRAKDALEQVGLGQHMHKKPSQLSGGQMQRVAIARALVNNPDILLADEPTGALDSETSLQVMDLLKEVAKDRLVVMVTHNPELADRYATRIVKLHDGKIIADSDPFRASDVTAEHKKPGKASMRVMTAFGLSLNNLWTKKVRTLLVAFAGSIGIIGIALILSLSNGANNYIRDTEENTLKSYPLTITASGMDFTSLLTDVAENEGGDGTGQEPAEVREWNMITKMFSQVTANDLKSLREFIETDDEVIRSSAQAVEYTYNVTPYLYAQTGGVYRQVNPDTALAKLGFSSGTSMNSMMSAFTNRDVFSRMPENDVVYKDQYELKAGNWPERYNECVLVLTRNGRVSDIALYAMGLKDPKTLDEIIQSFMQGKSYEGEVSDDSYAYRDFLGIEFRLLSPAQFYTYEEHSGSWIDRSEDEVYMEQLLDGAETVRIVGIVQPSGDTDAPLLRQGIVYPASLVTHLMELAAATPIVKAQLEQPQSNILTGVNFGEKKTDTAFDLSDVFSFDESALSSLFAFDKSALDFDPSAFDFSQLDFSGMQSLDGVVSEDTLKELLSSVEIELSEEDARALFSTLVEGYADYAAGDPSTDYGRLFDGALSYLRSEDALTLLSDKISEAIRENSKGLMSTEEISALLNGILDGFPAYAEGRQTEEPGQIAALLNEYLASAEVAAKLETVSQNINGRFAALELSETQLQGIAAALYDGYHAYAEANALPDPQKMVSSFLEYVNTPDVKEQLTETAGKVIRTDGLEEKTAELMQQAQGAVGQQLASVMAGAMGQVARQLQSRLQNAFSFDEESLKDAFSSALSINELKDLFNSLLSGDTTDTLQSVLAKLGYASVDEPFTITIYPRDFDSKVKIKDAIDRYNDTQEDAGNEDKIVRYTDVVDTLMSSVTKIIDAISAVLIAFVGISLVVSSVMIGVITYISVLERKKEIGILRAIGASKRNVSNVFNAETFIIGSLAGILGVGITLLLIIPANAILHAVTGQYGVNAALPPGAALLLIALSIVLTLIGGIIPSRKAAHSDPVTALRSE